MTGGLVTLGETMAVASAARIGTWAGNRELRLTVAGAESNVAIGVTRLGWSATWISRLGADGFGELIRRELRAEGVSVIAAVDARRPTGLLVRERPAASRSAQRYYGLGSAASALTAFDVVAEPVAAARVLHVTALTPALGPGPASAVQLAVDIAREHDVIVSLDLRYRAALWSREDAAEELTPLVRQADVVFARPDEATLIVPEAPVEKMAHALVELGPAEVVIRRDEGAVAVVGGVELAAEAPVLEVADPAGSDDAFAAGYLAELMAGETIEQRLDTALAAAAIASATTGDWEGLPTRLDLMAMDG